MFLLVLARDEARDLGVLLCERGFGRHEGLVSPKSFLSLTLHSCRPKHVDLMRRGIILALASVPLLVSALARADNYDSLVKPLQPQTENKSQVVTSTPEIEAPPKRRAGIVLGVEVGLGLAGSSGYPNDSNDIGDPNYYAASGLMTGGGGSVFVMGALSDYLNFGFFAGEAKFGTHEWYSSGAAGGLRVEIFPLYSLGGPLRDLGVLLKTGIGSTTLVNRQIGLSDGEPAVSQTGVGAFIAPGVFYEFWLFRGMGGHFALGPSLEYDAMYSESMERHGALLGLRFLWYGGK
jgi:hypothetical protein